jgi:hypothetical protein
MAQSSPFAALEATFRLLSEQPCPVAVDGRQLGHGAPARQIPISELRSIALHPATSRDLQGTVLDAVIAGLHQEEPATWIVVLGGILLPSMRRLAERTAVGSGQMSMLQIEAELLWRLVAVVTRRPPAATRRFAMHLLTGAWT